MVEMLTVLTYQTIDHLNLFSQYSSMFERQERVAFLLLVAVAIMVIGAHIVLAGLGKQPFAQPFTNSSSDGELVVVEGQIDQITLTKSGGHMTVSMNNLSIFLPAQVVQEVSLQKGDRISVYGIVQTYRGKKEIVVSAADDVRLIPVKSP
jgi:DNA/RNA endonuclease YhcR with UshA esterase domain